MINIAICDDEKVFAELIYSALVKIFNNISVDVKISIYKNPQLLLDSYNNKKIDILFLDIDMPEMTGFDVAERIRENAYKTQIIFVTSKDELVYNSFEYNPFYFIRKCVSCNIAEQLEHVINKLLLIYKQDKKITISDSSIGESIIAIKDIMYIQSEKHYLLYYTNKNFEMPMKERAVLGTREHELCQLDFLKPHQRYLVNMKYICRFDSLVNTITMKNGVIIPISKSLKNQAIEVYKTYKRR